MFIDTGKVSHSEKLSEKAEKINEIDLSSEKNYGWFLIYFLPDIFKYRYIFLSHCKLSARNTEAG